MQDLATATDLLVGPAQPEFVPANDDVDSDALSDSTQMLVSSAEQDPDLIVIGERDGRFGHAASSGAARTPRGLAGYCNCSPSRFAGKAPNGPAP